MALNAGTGAVTVTADIIDASGLTGTAGLTMSAQTSPVYSSGAHITGSAGVDALFGTQGVDIILGGADNDSLHGRAGSDRLTGGAGADTFVFAGVTASANGQDRITDFKHADLDLISFTGLGYTLGTKVTGAGAAVTTTDRADFVQIIDTDGSAGSITTSGTATLTASDLEATNLGNVAAFLAEKYSGVSSTTGTDDGVYIINFTKDGHDKSYVYGWDNDTTANVIQAGELALIGIVTRDAVLVNADITVA